MIERTPLKELVRLCGESDGHLYQRTFRILSKLNEGASSICYEAHHGKSGKGVLKEFYPCDAYALERNDEGHLVFSPGFEDSAERGRFEQAQKEYIEPYEMMLQAKLNAGDQDLATFIPPFEIYRGCDAEGRAIGTTYIWTPEPKLETFATICDEIHKAPTKEPERKLATVLTAIESLTKCIQALHSAEMVHRDIKPSNFGFLKRGNEALTQTISLFDINTVCSVYADFEGAVGTIGFMEPESDREAANNQTDIYAIGATLFYAIIVTDEVKQGGYLFHRGYYDQLRELVDASKLIQASEANEHPRLRYLLTTILRKCLGKRSSRYNNCEELLVDLGDALYYVLPSEITKKRRAGEKWVLADLEKSLDVNKEKNSFLSILYHLYAHPLYQCSPSAEQELNVLVIGFRNYGQKFLDATLQNGQMLDKKMRVTVVADDPTDKDIYLSERPALDEFFCIDGTVKVDRDSYGEINFEIEKLERNDPSALEKSLQDVMCRLGGERIPRYIFVSLGDDQLNEIAAKVCRTAVQVFEQECIVSYIQECERKHTRAEHLLCPLYINSDVKQSALYPEIERMAFNTHLVWEKSLNLDYRIIRERFRKPYNHDASVSSVLSLKYKLHSLHIELDSEHFCEAAALFTGKIRSGRGLKNELMWIEHRRWVAEKLCLGWSRIENLEECCEKGGTKDERRKRHVCICRSQPNQKLATNFCRNGDFSKWDSATDAELDELDDLDRMSVELHRALDRKAEQIRTGNLLSGDSIGSIRTLIEGDKKAMIAFQEWYTCLKDILNRDTAKVHLYESLKKTVLEATESFSGDRKRAVRDQISAFDTMFYPVRASMEYRDWKQDDIALIDNIPFILTYTEHAYLAIPFATGSNTEIFENLSAVTVVSPERILYLFYAETVQDLRELQSSIPYVTEYMRKKRLKGAVDFVIAYLNKTQEIIPEEIEREIRQLGKGRIRVVKILKVEQVEELPRLLEEYLKRRAEGKSFFAVEKNDSRLSYMLRVSGFYKAFPNYQFDSFNMKFTDRDRCDMLGYIRKTPFITVTDMAAFRLSASESSNQPEFYSDYKDLWDRYSRKSGLWKLLCDILNEYAESHDLLITIRKQGQKEKTVKSEKHVFILPFACSRSAEKILRFLIEKGFAEQSSSVTGYTSDSCMVVIEDSFGNGKMYEKLFSNVYALMQPDAINIYLNPRRREAVVTFDNLVVHDVLVPEDKIQEIRLLMDFFKEKHYVMDLSITPDGKMSFTYATRNIKELLSTAGKMLEVYTYHKIKELGKFDDVVSSFEIDWEGTDVRNEFDCILTKGFRSLFVECKARSDIEQEYYFKLASLAKQFGINATAVLIADTKEKSFYDNAPINAMQRKRGRMMDVVTIWRADEINNIGHTLLKIVNGNYVSEEG